MASSVVVTTGPVSGGGVRRGAPRKMFRGQTRTMIRKTLAHLNAISNRDFRENVRGASLNYNPAFVMDAGGTTDRRAFDRAIARLALCLTLLEGQS